MKPKLWSVGTAVFDSAIGDYHPEASRIEFTVESLVAHHPLVGEIIVVDNNPLPHSPVPALLAKTKKGRYVEMPEPVGTSVPRNRVFQEAKFNRVACIDAHVLLLPGFFESLNAFYAEHGWDCQDLLHGPMVNEDCVSVHGTHMDNRWRDHMWGTWGWAWWTPQRKRMFSATEVDGHVRYVSLDTDEQQPLEFKRGDEPLPDPLPWSGHQAKLLAIGCTPPTEPFKIPGHGMGFFACRKDAWLSSPFSDRCRGFGGEEMTTHRRFRKLGRSVWCVPGAKWWHSYTRSAQSGFQGPGHHAPPPYPISTRDRVRNYAIEFQRNGDNFQPIIEHFGTSQAELEALLRCTY